MGRYNSGRQVVPGGLFQSSSLSFLITIHTLSSTSRTQHVVFLLSRVVHINTTAVSWR
nr:MAG TPA: hypothetical protein [Caudoviricetes sp.]